MDEDDKNVFRPAIFQGGKNDENPNVNNELPVNDYVITDIDDNEFFATGFLVFTPHHFAVMQDYKGHGVIPVLAMPIGRVKSGELYDEEDIGQEMPFA